MKAINKKVFLNYLSLFFSLIFIGIIYFYKIKYYPIFMGDEASLLSIPYRAVMFGDIQYPVFYPQSVYDLGFFRGMPFINVFIFRVLYHLIFGFSPALSRVFSAILMVGSTLIVMDVCKKFYPKLSFWAFILIPIVIALTPAMILSARSIRVEQEILFWGVMGIFGSLAWLPRLKSKRLIWFFSGACTGLAATTHPFGIVFPCVLFASFFLHKKAWEAFDRLSFKPRLFAWGGGLSVPVFVTLGDILYKLHEYLNFLPGLQTMQALRTQTFIQIFSGHYLGLFHQWLPARIKAFLYQVSYYSFSTELMPFSKKYYMVIFWVTIALTTLFLSPIMKKRNQPGILPLALSCYLALGFFLFTFLFTPNQTYYVYLSFSFSTFLCLAYCNLLSNRDFIFPIPRKKLFTLGEVLVLGGVFYILFFLNILSSYSLLRTLIRLNPSEHVSLDAINKTIEKLKTDTGMPEMPQGETLIDSYTWPFAGKNVGSWITTIAGLPSHKEPIAGAFRGDSIDFFINVFPTLTTVQVPQNLRRHYFHNIQNKLELKAILVVPPLKLNHYFYVKPGLSKNNFQLLIMKNDSKTQTFTSVAPFSSLGSTPPLLKKTDKDGPLKITYWNIDQEGYYLLVLTSVAEGVKHKDNRPIREELMRSYLFPSDIIMSKVFQPRVIRFFQNKAEVIPNLQSQNTKEAPIFYLLKLKKGSLRAYGISPEQIIAFDHLIVDSH